MSRKRLGELLLEWDAIDEMQLRSALGFQRQHGHPLGMSLRALGMVDEETILQGLSAQFGIPWVNLPNATIPPGLVRLIPPNVARKYLVVPLAVRPEKYRATLFVAVADPRDVSLIDTLQFATGHKIQPVIASEAALEACVAELYPRTGRKPNNVH